MLSYHPIIAAVFVLSLGAIILWGNPLRAVNRAVFYCSFTTVVWLVFLHLAIRAAGQVFYFKCALAWGPFMVHSYWLVKETILGRFPLWDRRSLLRFALWVSLPVVMAYVCFTPYFIPPESTDAHRLYGPGYWFYVVADWCYSFAVCGSGWHAARKERGVARVELGVWFGVAGPMVLWVLVSMLLTHVIRSRFWVESQIVVLTVGYAITGWAITAKSVFDSKQVVFLLVKYVGLCAIVTLGAFLVNVALGYFYAQPVPHFGVVLFILYAGPKVAAFLDRTLKLYKGGARAREAVFSLARRYPTRGALLAGFPGIVKGWGQTERVVAAVGDKEGLVGDDFALPYLGPVVSELKALGWVTPERLARSRFSEAETALGGFLKERGLAAVVFCENTEVSLIVGAGLPPSRSPYTRPQVEELEELSSIILAALSRAVLAEKAHRADQLATVGTLGAHFAHEIRNPLVSIKTLAQLLPNHYADPVFREKFFSLVPNEIGRIHHLSTQLLNLSLPRQYPLDYFDVETALNRICDELDAKAFQEGVVIKRNYVGLRGSVYSNRDALAQIVSNLATNSFHALGRVKGERCLIISASFSAGSLEISVADNGPGIAAAVLPTLFEPLRSTKIAGIAGIGLGLAVCREICTSVGGRIFAERPPAGALFKVLLPTSESSDL